MPTPIMIGNQDLQGYVARRYQELHAQGYSKSEAHSIAFQELRQLKAQLEAQQQAEPDPFSQVIYNRGGGF